MSKYRKNAVKAENQNGTLSVYVSGLYGIPRNSAMDNFRDCSISVIASPDVNSSLVFPFEKAR